MVLSVGEIFCGTRFFSKTIVEMAAQLSNKELQYSNAADTAKLAGVTMNDLKDQNCGLEPCLYEDQVNGLGPIKFDANDRVCMFPCERKCHGICYRNWLGHRDNANNGCPYHVNNEHKCVQEGLALKSAKTLAKMGEGGRRRSKRSKRSKRTTRSKRSKRSKQSKRSKRS